MELLKISLDLKDDEEVTFISDMQKGLLEVVSKKPYREDFDDQLKKLGELSVDATKGLVYYPPNKWCRVMNMLRVSEEECENWKEENSPYSMTLHNDYRVVAQGCKVEFNGDHGYEVTKGGEIFWKIELHHAMEPPLATKMVGTPKLKRAKEKDEARKREGIWSSSRKGLLMTCGYCDEEEDSKSILRPKVKSEARRLQQRKLLQQPIGIRKIDFKGDEIGVNVPTKMPYSPKKVTWKGKTTMTSNQLVAEKGKK
ncbi:hypothetical protein HAX54_010974 [Datura stramonium]|uniref:Uncharacterized protein n=1 Tax=Datura stramonium TaxID=4076 RepID=A0ABS8TIQ5_DATST|nr:hypothetical protein [Datura stramonium]